MKPLLSICIPTYNRASLLRSLLYSVVPQVAKMNGLVEIVVSDNCSTDDTGQVVDWARQFGPISYHRNDENIGGARNFIKLAQVLAKGEYCWLIGDDDMVRLGAVQRVVEGLQAHPEIDYAFVNYTPVVENRDGSLLKTESYSDMARRQCFDTETKIVPRFEQIISFTKYDALFTYIGCHILRTRLWREQEIPATDDKNFPSMITTFPHAYVVALHLVGKPVLYFGEPGIILMSGAQDWITWYPFIRLVRMVELSDFMDRRGADRKMTRRYRDLIFQHGCYDYWNLMRDSKLQGRESFHPLHYFKYADHKMFWQMLTLYPVNEFIKPIFRPLTRRLKRMMGTAKSSLTA